MTKFKILLMSITVILITGCQKQIPQKKIQNLEDKRIGIFSKVKNTVDLEGYDSFNVKSIAHWKINEEIERFIYEELKSKNKYSNLKIVKRTQDVILFEEGNGKGVPSIVDIAKNERLDYIVYIFNFWEHPQRSGGLTFFKRENIFNNNVSENLYLNLALVVAKVGEDKLHSLYFVELDKKDYLFREYTVDNDKPETKDKLSINKDIDKIQQFVKEVLYEEVSNNLKKAGLF